MNYERNTAAMDCIFCRIIAQKAPGSRVYEDSLALAFLDIHPVTMGHLLIVPKMHVERFSKLPDELAGHLFKVARRILEALERSELPLKAANLFLSDGELAGQEVMHSHLHLAPRYENDGQHMGFLHDSAKNWPRVRLDQVASQIRAALENQQTAFAEIHWPQPQIETSRLLLRPFTSDDIEDIFSYASKEGIDKYVPWFRHKSLEDSQMFLEYVARSSCEDPSRLFYIFAMELKSESRVIGAIDFKRPGLAIGQIDYAMDPDQWQKGLMSEAATAIRDWAFAAMPEIERLQAFCVKDNLGSARVMEKIGMKFEGCRRKAFLLKGESVDLLDHSILREEWKELKT